jgi:hypothetical protein
MTSKAVGQIVVVAESNANADYVNHARAKTSGRFNNKRENI